MSVFLPLLLLATPVVGAVFFRLVAGTAKRIRDLRPDAGLGRRKGSEKCPSAASSLLTIPPGLLPGLRAA